MERCEGDQADRLMRMIESLEDDLEEEFGGDTEKLRTVRVYISCFKQFRAVTKACFGTSDLDPNYEHLIREFMGSIRSLGWKNIPLKFHLVESHIVPFIKMFGEKWPLGYFSEQVRINLQEFNESSIHSRRWRVCTRCSTRRSWPTTSPSTRITPTTVPCWHLCWSAWMAPIFNGINVSFFGFCLHCCCILCNRSAINTGCHKKRLFICNGGPNQSDRSLGGLIKQKTARLSENETRKCQKIIKNG